MHQEYRLSVITVNYNGLHDTCALLDHLTFNPADTEVIVVDNGSANNEAEVITYRYPDVRCIRSEKNLGFAGGNNLGIKHAVGKYLFFVNNDTEVNMEDIDKLVMHMESMEHIGIMCPKIRFYYGKHSLQCHVSLAAIEASDMMSPTMDNTTLLVLQHLLMVQPCW